MLKNKEKCFLFVVIGFFSAFICSANADGPISWKEIKGGHFIVYYTLSGDVGLARDVLRKSEEYYRSIGDRVGYTRYSQFWTWDERVKILLFPDHQSFLEETGLPSWSNGFSDRDTQVFRSRAIVTFRQEKDFLDGLLPHEISHLVMHDYIPSQNLPIWLDEGIAQFTERNKKEWAEKMVRAAYQQEKLIPFAVLLTQDIRQERDAQKAGLFYAESLSVVNFLMTQYSQESFRRLCRGLRDSLPFGDAFSTAYGNQIRSVSELQKKWLDSISR